MDIPLTLKEKLAERKVIPFVGAGVSMAIRGKESDMRLFPSWKELLLHAADRLTRESKSREANLIQASLDVGDPDFLYIASQAKKYLGTAWTRFLKEELNQQRDSVQDDSLTLPKLIWQLGSQLIITTNYDKVLRWSCPNTGDCETWNIEHKAELAHFLARQDAEKPTVWHLHGSIEDASRIILTRDGYNLLYADDAAERLYKAALQTFRSILSSHTLLFVGCSFNDEQIGMQLQGIANIFDGCVGPHYALIKDDEKARLKGLNLPIEPLTFSDYGQPLINCVEALAHCTVRELHPASASAPTPSVSDNPSTTSPRPHYHPSNPVFHVPFAPKGNQVIGRDEALAKVRKQLTEGRMTAIGHTASFKGLGGLGKTQLAVEYAHQFRDSYPNGVIWLNADQDIEAQLTELAVTAAWIAPESEHKDKLDLAKQRLRCYGDCLVIFDNLEDQGVIRPYLHPGITSHVLVTSRVDQPGFTPIPLDPLDPERSFELLCQEACRKPENAEEDAAARGIVSFLGGLPLAIELAGAYLCHRSTFTFTDYLTRLRDDPLKALPEKYLSSFTGHDPDLYRTLKINEELFAEEPLLIPILDLLTWSGPAPMGIELMGHLLETKETELHGALALGVELRIVQKSPDVERHAIHRLVREVRRVECPLQERMEWGEYTASRLGDWFQSLREEFVELPRFEAEIDHLIAWCDNCRMFPRLNARLTWLQAYPPYHRGNYHKAHEIVKLALDLIDEDNSEPDELNAHIYSDNGSTFGYVGDFKNSLRFQEQALEIRKKLFGDAHPDTATSYDNVGGTYGCLGDHKKALEFQQKALDIRRALFGDDHCDTAASYNNVGGTYGSLGDHKKALEFQQRALDISRALFGNDHPNTATSYNNVGNTYGELRDHQKALEFQQKALNISCALFGDDHPHTATSYDNVGSTYGDLGDYKKAFEFKQKALDIRCALFGDDHPDTATSYNNVGCTYGELGDHIKALEFQLKALDIRRALFGDDHPDTATCYKNVGSTYGELGDHIKALESQLKALDIRRVRFGDDHPGIVNLLFNIGLTYFHLGKTLLAVDTLQKALRIGKKVLPNTHPLISSIEKSLKALLARTKGFRSSTKTKKRH